MMKRRCLSMGRLLTPALLEQWIGESCRSFRLSRKAQVRLIAALDKNILCCLEAPKRQGKSLPAPAQKEAPYNVRQ
jgi:hypothetical protein